MKHHEKKPEGKAGADALDADTRSYLYMASQLEFQLIRDHHAKKIRAIKTNEEAREYIHHVRKQLAELKRRTPH